MFSKFKMSWGHKKEKKVIALMQKHIELLSISAQTLTKYLKEKDSLLIGRICCLEREADLCRREALSLIFKGAFFPYMRSIFYDYIDHIEEAFDMIVNSATILSIIPLDPFISGEFVEISSQNELICKLLLKEFNMAIKGKDSQTLENLSSKIRDVERKVDNIKMDVLSKMSCIEINNFWEGKFLYDLFKNLISFTDVIEDASDILYLISISFH